MSAPTAEETTAGWARVIGQARVVETLRRGLAAGRVPQAYLFHGPPGSGKRVAALALAQALLCHVRPAGSDEPCGRCSACRRVPRLLHPDVQLHLPQPKEPDLADVGKRLERLGAHPYAEVDYTRRPDLDNPEKTANKQALYTVDRMREINRSLRLTPAEGSYRVAVFVEVESMNVNAANAFLKNLEEPTPSTVLILTATRADALLPTVVSRCQRLRFDPLAPEAIETALMTRDGLDAVQAGLLARMADGSYTRALDLAANASLAEQRADVVAFLRHVYQRPSLGSDDFVEALSRKGREPIKAFLRLLILFQRDLLLARELGEAAPLINVDQAATIRKFVEAVASARLDDMTALAEEAIGLIERNVNTLLVLTVLAQALRRAMHGKPVPHLAAPLAEPTPA